MLRRDAQSRYSFQSFCLTYTCPSKNDSTTIGSMLEGQYLYQKLNPKIKTYPLLISMQAMSCLLFFRDFCSILKQKR